MLMCRDKVSYSQIRRNCILLSGPNIKPVQHWHGLCRLQFGQSFFDSPLGMRKYGGTSQLLIEAQVATLSGTW